MLLEKVLTYIRSELRSKQPHILTKTKYTTDRKAALIAPEPYSESMGEERLASTSRRVSVVYDTALARFWNEDCTITIAPNLCEITVRT